MVHVDRDFRLGRVQILPMPVPVEDPLPLVWLAWGVASVRDERDLNLHLRPAPEKGAGCREGVQGTPGNSRRDGQGGRVRLVVSAVLFAHELNLGRPNHGVHVKRNLGRLEKVPALEVGHVQPVAVRVEDSDSSSRVIGVGVVCQGAVIVVACGPCELLPTPLKRQRPSCVSDVCHLAVKERPAAVTRPHSEPRVGGAVGDCQVV